MDASEKTLFFVRGIGDRERFVRDVLERARTSLEALGPRALKISLTEQANPRFSLVPLRRKNLAMVSVTGSVDPSAVIRVLEGCGDEVFGYRVDESIPLAIERTWPLGERSPGVVLLTLLVKHPELDREAFMHEWHGVHTPKALRIHPMWGYVRNVVRERLTDSTPPFDGVVEEHYRTLADVMNPVRMFGGPRRFVAGIVEVMRHVRHFLDLRRTENYLLTEYRVLEAAQDVDEKRATG